MSIKDRTLKKKKYTGVWRWESMLIRMIRPRLQMRVTRYIPRKIRKTFSCSSLSSEIPRRPDMTTEM